MDKSRQQLLTRWLRQHRSLAKPWISLCIVTGTVSTVLLVLQSFLLAYVLHGLIIEHGYRESFYPYILGLILVAFSRAGCAWLKEQFAFRGAAKIRQHIRASVFTELERRGPLYIQRTPTGSWASLLVEQIEHLHDFYARFLPQSMLSGLQPFIILLVVFPINWASGLILLLTAPLIPLFMILTGLGAADANRRNFKALSRLSAHFLDRLQGLMTLRLYSRTEQEGKNIEEASEEFRSRTMEVLRMAFLSSAVLEFFASIAIALVAVYFGFSYLGHLDFGGYGSISLFSGLMVLLLAPDFYLPLRELGAHYHAKAQAIGAADQIESFFNTSVVYVEQGAEQVSDEPWFIEATDCSVLSTDGDVLAGPFTFQIKPKQFVAIVGKTGSGKSSFLYALLGFAPYQGSLKINGKELSSLDLRSYRQFVGWLSQNPKLLPGTIRSNLLLGNSDISEAQLDDVLVQAGAMDIVQQKGLDYFIAEQSSGLSVGQAQRIALARTLLKPCHLLLLDEPTASLDRINEQLIMDALSDVLHRQTTLLVTHRVDQLSSADLILMFADGQLVAQGNYESLKTSTPEFVSLLNHEAVNEVVCDA